MREITKVIRAQVLDYSELSEKSKRLLESAAEVRQNAQAPYSRYRVGVAIFNITGGVFVGCNVERCTWTQTTHAEQSAVDTMVSECGSVKVARVGLVAAPEDVEILFPPEVKGDLISSIDEIPVPCGHCLQIIWENCFNDPRVELVALAGNGEVTITTIGDAFPMRLGPHDLGVDYARKE